MKTHCRLREVPSGNGGTMTVCVAEPCCMAEVPAGTYALMVEERRRHAGPGDLMLVAGMCDAVEAVR